MRDTAEPFPVAKGVHVVTMLPAMTHRHGLIAGATGTGKTTTLRVLAENFSAISVPVFLADIKGDPSGIAKAGGDNPKILYIPAPSICTPPHGRSPPGNGHASAKGSAVYSGTPLFHSPLFMTQHLLCAECLMLMNIK
jgi:hypothetical protein